MKFMTPAQYLMTLSRDARRELAVRMGTTDGHLRNVQYGDRSLNEVYAMRLERETSGVVPRQLSLPDEVWRELWPDLQPLPNLEPSSESVD